MYIRHISFFFFQAEDGIRDSSVTGVQTCALPITYIGWSGRVDPDGNTYDFNYTGRPLNDSSYSNADVDKLLDDQRQTSDEAKRKAALRKAEQIFVVDDPAPVSVLFGVPHHLSHT